VGYIFKWIYGIPYVVYAHGQEIVYGSTSFKSGIDHVLKRLVLRQADAVIAISEYTRSRVLEWGSQDTSVVTIPLGADPREFSAKRDLQEILEDERLRGHRIVLTVSRLVSRKGHEQVIRALPVVSKVIPNVVYVVVGDGPERERLESLARDLALSDRVIFTGEVDRSDLPSYYHACELFVLTSTTSTNQDDFEGFGLAYLEASACGKPVVGGRGGGVPEAVRDGVTGLLVDSENVEQIADTLVKILSNHSLAQRLGENGRDWVEKSMNWSETAGRVQEILQAIEKHS
jgi:phosphatidylinositol alpha-1,6-mannosyltransferase